MFVTTIIYHVKTSKIRSVYQFTDMCKIYLTKATAMTWYKRFEDECMYRSVGYLQMFVLVMAA